MLALTLVACCTQYVKRVKSVAYWYQILPSAPFPELPDKDYLEII